MSKTEKEPGVSATQSPRFFRRKLLLQPNPEPADASQGKVVLGEVEEKLKSMRQKRLDRLSMFVVEQSKLSEERSNTNKEGTEIEDAIISMKQTIEEKKVPLKLIVEQRVAESKEKRVSEDKNSEPRTPKLLRKSSNESADKSKLFQKSSSTKKFISKFNCTNTEVGSSTEDLVDDGEYSKSNFFISDGDNKKPVLNRNSYEKDKTKSTDNTTSGTENITSPNPILSPLGKQRHGVYLYDREYKFLFNEKLAAMSAITKNEGNSHQLVKKPTEPPSMDELRKPFLNPPGNITTEEIPLRKPQERKLNEFGKVFLDTNVSVGEQISRAEVIELKTRNSAENRSDNTRPPLVMKTFKSNSLGNIADSKIAKCVNPALPNESPLRDNKNSKIVIKTEVINEGNRKISKDFKQSAYENIDLQPYKKHKMTGRHEKNGSRKKSDEDVQKIPMPLPRKITDGERILKKFQRNYDNLNEILENDSDVDTEEIEDLKKTFAEVSTLLMEYKTKLNKLEEKSKSDSNCCEILSAIKEQVKTIEEEIPKFKGLKRDSTYQELSNKLSNCLLDINKFRSAKPDIQNEKHSALKQVENCLDILERTVNRNEEILFEVLEAQVASIGTNILNITRV